jgi:hypothetical protein
MNTLKLLLAPIALATLLALSPAPESVGKSMPAIPVDGLAQTKAKSLDDYLGRAVLIEFFAYW